jgi:hypothetical protein
METVILDQKNETPYVKLDSSLGEFYFTGKSYPENVHHFYSAVIDYLNTYVKSPQPKTTAHFTWTYFNTATSKILVKIILTLKEVLSQGKDFEINWYCKSDDYLMIEKGQELKDLLGVKFNIVFI